MAKGPEEWFTQAEYDMSTADYMFDGGRYFYVVFMCHLSIEKALKGLYLKKLTAEPPKVHNLIYLLNKTSLKPPEAIGRFMVKLNEASIPTRYPEDIDKLQKDYTLDTVRGIIAQAKETLEWIKKQY
jgi:HEPN domain-containing protein